MAHGRHVTDIRVTRINGELRNIVRFAESDVFERGTGVGR